jgi:ABC-type transport system involved in cytochrome c biogenesis permease subunit
MVWAGAVLALLGFLLSRWVDGRLSLLLTAHIFALTAGYGTALMAGGLGIVEICSRRAGRSVMRADQLASALRRGVQAAAGMVVLGLILGLVWNAENHGRLWSGAPQELGTIIAALWLVAVAVVQRFAWFSLRHAVLLSVAGNVIIGFAWVGAVLLARGQGIGSVWQFDALVALHLFFLGLGRFSMPKALRS